MDRNAQAVHEKQVANEQCRIDAEMKAPGFDKAKQFSGLYDEFVPDQVFNPQSNVLTVLPPDARAIILGYMFMGLAELVSASSGQDVKTIWKACAERSIHNLKKDGLIE